MNPKPSCSAYCDGQSVIICGYRYGTNGLYYADDRHRTFPAQEKDQIQSFILQILASPVPIDPNPKPIVDKKRLQKMLKVRSGKEAVGRYRIVSLSIDGDVLTAYSTRRELKGNGAWFFKPEAFKCESWRDGTRTADLLWHALAACE